MEINQEAPRNAPSMRPQNKNLRPPWPAGQSGNPRGLLALTMDQKQERKQAREMLRAAAPRAVERLIKAIDSSDEKNAIRACLAILDKTVPTLTLAEINTPDLGPHEHLLRELPARTLLEMMGILEELPKEIVDSAEIRAKEKVQNENPMFY